MPYDGNGNASVTRNVAVTGQTVLAEQVNVPFADIQNMLSQVFLRSGVAPMTGPLNSNGFRQLNVGDPESDGDGTNKSYVDDQITSALSTVNANARKIETVNANRLALLADKATSFRVTGTRTVTLTAAATLLANWWCEVWAVDGVVTIDPDAAETINGNATLILNAGQKAIVFCTGTAFFAFVTSDAQSGVQLQGYSFGLALSNNAGDAANDVDILSGKAAADTSPFNLMVLSGALTKRIDASWAVGTGNGGLDTGGVSAAGTYYIWIIQRSDTGVTDALFSLSNTAPTMPGSYDRKRLIGSVTRLSSVNSTPRYQLSNDQSEQIWVNFNGATGSIRGSQNVSSVVKNGTGDYTINYSVIMDNLNYCIFATPSIASAGSGNTIALGESELSPRTLNSVRIISRITTNNSPVDASYINVMIVR